MKISKSDIVRLKPNNKGTYAAYLKNIEKYKPLSREEEHNLFEAYNLTGDEKAYEKIYKHNLLFVVFVAVRYGTNLNSSTLSLEDLINEGNLGLATAIRKFDNKKGFKFISYAVWYITQMITHSINENTRIIRLTPHAQSSITAIRKKTIQMEQLQGGDVTDIEVYEAMLEEKTLGSNLHLGTFENLINASKKTKSLDEPFLDNYGEKELSYQIADDNMSQEEMVLTKEREKIVLSLLDTVNVKYRGHIIDYFGLLGNPPMTFAEIGKKHNLTRAAIQLHVGRELARLKYRYKNLLDELSTK